jgi:hypothetical protein
MPHEYHMQDVINTTELAEPRLGLYKTGQLNREMCALRLLLPDTHLLLEYSLRNNPRSPR